MNNLMSESLREGFTAGVNAAFSKFDREDLNSLIMAPYLELQTEYVGVLRLAA